MGRRKSGKKPKLRSVKQIKASPDVTPRLSRFAAAYMKTRNKTKSAIIAGYAPKHAAQAGYKAMELLKEKAPEVMARLGITLESVVEKKLVPLMNAVETKFAQHEGKFTDRVEVNALAIQLGAMRTALELLNAFPPKDPQLAAQVGIEVVVLDVPRPDRSMVNVTPGRVIKPQPLSGNGAKPEDPRPKD